MFSWNVGGSIKVEIQCDGKPIEIVDLRGMRYAVIPNDASFFEQGKSSEQNRLVSLTSFAALFPWTLT